MVSSIPAPVNGPILISPEQPSPVEDDSFGLTTLLIWGSLCGYLGADEEVACRRARGVLDNIGELVICVQDYLFVGFNLVGCAWMLSYS